MTKTIDIVFDGPPGPTSGRFVEVEDESGKSIDTGDWVNREDGFWVLRLPDHCALTAELSDARQALYEVAEQRNTLTAEVSALKKDQTDWRKGVELIASSLGESDPPNLSCVRIAHIALKLRATLEDTASGSPKHCESDHSATNTNFNDAGECISCGYKSLYRNRFKTDTPDSREK